MYIMWKTKTNAEKITKNKKFVCLDCVISFSFQEMTTLEHLTLVFQYWTSQWREYVFKQGRVFVSVAKSKPNHHVIKKKKKKSFEKQKIWKAHQHFLRHVQRIWEIKNHLYVGFLSQNINDLVKKYGFLYLKEHQEASHMFVKG